MHFLIMHIIISNIYKNKQQNKLVLTVIKVHAICVILLQVSVAYTKHNRMKTQIWRSQFLIICF